MDHLRARRLERSWAALQASFARTCAWLYPDNQAQAMGLDGLVSAASGACGLGGHLTGRDASMARARWEQPGRPRLTRTQGTSFPSPGGGALLPVHEPGIPVC